MAKEVEMQMGKWKDTNPIALVPIPADGSVAGSAAQVFESVA